MILEVGYTAVRIITEDGRLMTVREILAREQGEIKALRDFDPSMGPTSVEIVFRYGPFRRKLRISPRLENAILSHLFLYHAQTDLAFDCYAFVNLVHDLPRHEVRDLMKYWILKPMAGPPVPGEVYFLVNPDDGSFYHACIYLGMGLYISVWGAGGDIEIATIRDMRREFKAKEVYLAVPKVPIWNPN